jgi:putative ABC transport system substrate-binding protein
MQSGQLQRRQFITLLGGAAAEWPLAARAQQRRMPVIGFLGSSSAEPQRLAAFHEGLKQAGFIEGQNAAVEYRWAEGKFAQLPALAADLVDRRVAVIVVAGTPAAHAAKAATAALPIVFAIGGDPIQLGLVASLSRPGGNVTGVTTLEFALGPKQLQLLHELVPAATTIALLVNPANRTAVEARDMQAAARAVGVELLIMSASTNREVTTAFENLVRQRAGALVIGSDNFFNARAELFAQLATQHKLPAISQFRQFAAAGGLVSYGTPVLDMYRQAGVYTGHILNEKKPADLPVLQPTKFELVINLKTAKAFGLTVPLTLQAGADEVIE